MPLAKYVCAVCRRAHFAGNPDTYQIIQSDPLHNIWLLFDHPDSRHFPDYLDTLQTLRGLNIHEFQCFHNFTSPSPQVLHARQGTLSHYRKSYLDFGFWHLLQYLSTQPMHLQILRRQCCLLHASVCHWQQLLRGTWLFPPVCPEWWWTENGRYQFMTRLDWTIPI